MVRRNIFRGKKVIDLNDKENILRLSEEIEGIHGIDKKLKNPLNEAINVLRDYDENHDLTIDQIRKIYSNLNITETMTPEEMDESLRCISHRIAILDKKFFQASIERKDFVSLIENILRHFSNIVEGDILNAISKIIENFSCICLMSKDNFSYKDVCFKFFTKNPDSDHVLVLILNIHYQQSSLSYKIMNIFKYKKEKIHLNFLGALVKTDIPKDLN